MLYTSTRSKENILFKDALMQGIASDGGLFVPTNFPSFNIKDFKNLSYNGMAQKILAAFLSDFSLEDIKYCVERAYDDKFDVNSKVVLKNFDDVSFLETFHGPTYAFKDMALTILPQFMETTLKEQGYKKKVIILTATSGDTGKAALEGFKDLEGIKIMVFYPEGGVSKIQKLQMQTAEGENVRVVPVWANFDECQGFVKNIFNDDDFKKVLDEKNYIFSSANSINIGRLLPQIIYYFYSYMKLVEDKQIELNDKINFCVPTGNFGDILAGFYAKSMGLPINKLICASNENCILKDFLNTGIYDANRAFVKTISPSMDILISSNLERFLYHMLDGNKEEKINKLFKDLKENKKFSIDEKDLENINSIMKGYMTGDVKTSFIINKVFKEKKYIIDPHTAVAYSCYQQYVDETKDNTRTVIISTASPYKFVDDVLDSISVFNEGLPPKEKIKRLSELSGTKCPKNLLDVLNKEKRFKKVVGKEELKAEVESFIKK